MLGDLNIMSLLSRLQASPDSALPNPQPVTLVPSNPSVTGDDDPLIQARIAQLFNPQTEATDRLRNYEHEMPQRNDPQFAPGKLRSTGAFLAGLGTGSAQGINGGQPIGFKSDVPTSLKVQDAIRNESYYKAKDDYEDRLKPLKESAEAEGRLNSNNRAIGSSLLTNERQIKSNESLAKHRENQDSVANEKVEISRQRALAYDFKTRNPQYKSYIDKEGKLVFVNPQDPNDIKQTGIDTGKLSDADKLALQLEGRLEAIKKSTEGRITAEDNAETNRETLEEKRYPNGRPPKSATAPGSKPPNPAAQNRDLINRANQLVSEHPEYKGYLEITAQGVKVKPSGIFGNEKTRMAAYNALYGAATPGKEAPALKDPSAPVKPKSKYQVTITK